MRPLLVQAAFGERKVKKGLRSPAFTEPCSHRMPSSVGRPHCLLEPPSVLSSGCSGVPSRCGGQAAGCAGCGCALPRGTEGLVGGTCAPGAGEDFGGVGSRFLLPTALRIHVMPVSAELKLLVPVQLPSSVKGTHTKLHWLLPSGPDLRVTEKKAVLGAAPCQCRERGWGCGGASKVAQETCRPLWVAFSRLPTFTHDARKLGSDGTINVRAAPRATTSCF